MTLVSTRTVDWRHQLDALDSYFRGLGGVVHVRLGNDSPASAFSRVLRTTMEKGSWPFPWRTVQIDPTNASTHYIPDILFQISKSVGLDPPPSSNGSESPALAISVGDGARAKGSIHIHDIDITSITSGYEGPQREADRIRLLCDAMKELLLTEKVALLFMESHNATKNDLGRIRRVLWDGALAELTEDGLLLIDLSNPSKSPVDGFVWPPDANLSLDLPDRYDEQSRQHARGDLIDIALNEAICASHTEAVMFSETLLAASENIRDLHTRLSLSLTRLGGGNR